MYRSVSWCIASCSSAVKIAFAATHGAMLACPDKSNAACRSAVDNRVVGAIAIRQHFVARWPHRAGAAPRHGLIDAVGIDAALEEALHLWHRRPAIRGRA